MAYDKVVDSSKLDATLGGIADAIRAKTGKADELTLEQMATEIAGIQTGDDDTILVSMVERTMTDFVATDKMQKIGDFAFQNVKSLRSVDLSNLGAQSGSLNKLIGYDAFSGCENLEHVVLPKVLETASQSTQWILSRAFSGTNLSEFVTDYSGEFGWISVQIFKNCKALRYVRIPNIRLVSFEYFGDCPALELVEFGGGQIGMNTFRKCTALHTIIIRSDAVAALNDINAFSGITGLVNIYVNESLIESYRTATNWASLYAAGTVDFVPIEGSEYE